MKRRLLISCLLAALCGGLGLSIHAQATSAQPTHAQQWQSSGYTLLAQAQRAAASPAEAARIAKQRYGGKILKVDTITTQRGVIYKVKVLLDNGRVRSVTIPGQ